MAKVNRPMTRFKILVRLQDGERYVKSKTVEIADNRPPIAIYDALVHSAVNSCGPNGAKWVRDVLEGKV